MLMEVPHLFLLVLCLIIPVVYFCLKKSCPNETKNFTPGSTGWPVIGETLEYFPKRKQGLTYKFLTERCNKYSSNTFLTSLLGVPMLIFSTAERNKFLFSNEKKLVQLWWPRMFGQIFLKSDDKRPSHEHTLKLHKLLQLIINPDGLREFVGIMDAVMKERLQTYKNSKEMIVVDMAKRYLLTLSFNIFIGISDPAKIETLGQRLEKIEEGLYCPINFPGTPLNRAVKLAKLNIEEFEEISRQRRIELLGHDRYSSPRKDLMSVMLLVAKDGDGNLFSDYDIVSYLAGLMLSAYTTMHSTICSTMGYLAELPEVYYFVLREQQAIVDGKEKNYKLTWEDLRKMKYTWNVVCEVLRISTPGIGGFREALTDFTYEGYTISKGSKIHWTFDATHMNPKHFKDPEKFDPSRFQGNGPAPYTYVPFGAGPRMCPGNEYARVAILTLLHNMVTHYRWEKLIPDEKIIHSPFPRPAQGLPISLHPHDP